MALAVIFGVSRRCAPSAAAILCLLAASGRAMAEPSADDKALATTLFREARALMTDGHTPEACAKFAESHRLDPSGGTILNLALCHEKEGKLARSWSEFSEAIAFARRDYRADREAEAQDHATKLEPRLSRLTIVVPETSKVEGLRVERDGRELAEPSWALAIPVDGGEHIVRATAPGHLPWSQTVQMEGEAGTATVEIPALALAPPPPPPPAPVERPASFIMVPASAPEGNPRRTAGWICGAAAVVQLGVAGYYGLQAFSLKSDINRNDEALRDADRSTVLTITGIVTAGISAYLFWTSRHHGHG
ncbi:MAG TPA: hypothetical protein VKQ32_20180 [Polyangia bacterium]|nr:hypothetical protein [Polyangia bacterium]